MKKSFLLTFILLFIVTSFVFAQNLRIYNNDTLLANNTVLNITGSNSQTIVQYLLVKNISNTAINVKVKKIYNSIVSGSENTFCFGVCYDPMTFLSDAVSIASNAVDSGFSADYNAHGGGGTSSIRYVFFNTANTSDSASVILNFTTTVGINDIAQSGIYFSEAYPNPASGTISFNYSIPEQTAAKIYIANILGAKVADVELSDLSGQKSINTANLKDGIYFYSLIVNDKIFKTRKMIIRH
ncbi:MAG: T9SS type A sorting domain-containing protein [Bacteroidales bacterium]